MARTEKIVQITAINQDTFVPVGQWLDFPSPSASLDQSSSQAGTTIFGSGGFESNLPTIFSHSLSGSGYLRETAGYNATLKRAGTGVTFTGEPMTQVGTTNTFFITDSSKNLWNPRAGVVVYAGASAVDEDDYTVDYMFGRVTFNIAPVGVVTVDGQSMPTAVFASANSIDVTQSAATSDITTFQLAQDENGYASYRPELLTVSLELSGFYNSATNMYDVLNARDEVIIEIDWTGNGGFISRGIFRVTDLGNSGDVGAVEDESVSFTVSSIEGITPYSFQFGATSEASTAFQLIANAWLKREYIGFRYAPEGLDEPYFAGRACVTDASISTSVSGIGELSVDLQGSGELERVA